MVSDVVTNMEINLVSSKVSETESAKFIVHANMKEKGYCIRAFPILNAKIIPLLMMIINIKTIVLMMVM